MKTRRETLQPLLERMVDLQTIDRAILPLWGKSYPPDDMITIQWMQKVIAERQSLKNLREMEGD